MAHPEQLEFVEKVKAAFPQFFTSVRTLEIGSLDINGSIRGFFDNGHYIGLDVAIGPGVDVVCQGQDYAEADDSFDTVISCEVMEHNPFWKETLSNMIRVCRPGGLVLMTCANTGRKEHGTTRTTASNSPLSVSLGWEYYRNLTASDFLSAIPLSQKLTAFKFFTNWATSDIYLIGFKRGLLPPTDAHHLIAALQRYYWHANLRHLLHSNYLQKRLLIRAFGEERYWTGPFRIF